jgi:hypothetical protein
MVRCSIKLYKWQWIALAILVIIVILSLAEHLFCTFRRARIVETVYDLAPLGTKRHELEKQLTHIGHQMIELVDAEAFGATEKRISRVFTIRGLVCRSLLHAEFVELSLALTRMMN